MPTINRPKENSDSFESRILQNRTRLQEIAEIDVSDFYKGQCENLMKELNEMIQGLESPPDDLVAQAKELTEQLYARQGRIAVQLRQVLGSLPYPVEQLPEKLKAFESISKTYRVSRVDIFTDLTECLQRIQSMEKLRNSYDRILNGEQHNVGAILSDHNGLFRAIYLEFFAFYREEGPLDEKYFRAFVNTLKKHVQSLIDALGERSEELQERTDVNRELRKMAVAAEAAVGEEIIHLEDKTLEVPDGGRIVLGSIYNSGVSIGENAELTVNSSVLNSDINIGNGDTVNIHDAVVSCVLNVGANAELVIDRYAENCSFVVGPNSKLELKGVISRCKIELDSGAEFIYDEDQVRDCEIVRV